MQVILNPADTAMRIRNTMLGNDRPTTHRILSAVHSWLQEPSIKSNSEDMKIWPSRVEDVEPKSLQMQP